MQLLMCVAHDTLHYRYLSEADFVSAIAPTGDFAKIGRQQYGILFRIADQRKRGKVTWDDFVAFETLLKRPDAEYDVGRRYRGGDESASAANATPCFAPYPISLRATDRIQVL